MSQVLARNIESAYRERFAGSQKLYERALKLFPNGVTHDGRYLEPFPIYVDRAAGSRKWDVDGNELIDYWVGHGALLLGHSHPAVVEAVRHQAGLSTHPGACHELEIEWAEWVRRLVPSAELVRFTNSGTEATLMALRVARIATGRSKIVKFLGHFHGWHDAVMPAAEPPDEAGRYSTPGVTNAVVDDLVLVPPNDLAAVARAIDEHRPACVIHEGNGTRWGTVLARADFMQGLRQLTRDKGVLLVLDEVITGFRVHPGGFQAHCGIDPDLSTFAKVLAGGLPGGCLAGRREVMQTLAFNNPTGKKMKHPGTYNGNPLSAAAGCAALSLVATGEPCRIANEGAASLRRALNDVFERKHADWVAYGDFSAIKILPGYEGPRPHSDDFIPYGNDFHRLDCKIDSRLSHAFRCALLLGGVDWMGWGGSTSSAHTDSDIERTADAFANAIDLLRRRAHRIGMAVMAAVLVCPKCRAEIACDLTRSVASRRCEFCGASVAQAEPAERSFSRAASQQWLVEEVPPLFTPNQLISNEQTQTVSASSESLRYTIPFAAPRSTGYRVLATSIALFLATLGVELQGGGWRNGFPMNALVPLAMLFEILFITLIVLTVFGRLTVELTPDWLLSRYLTLASIGFSRRVATRDITRIAVCHHDRSRGSALGRRFRPKSYWCLAYAGTQAIGIGTFDDPAAAHKYGGAVRFQLRELGIPTADV